MSGILGEIGNKTGVILRDAGPPLFIGNFSPTSRSTSNSSYVDVDLSLHHNLLANWNDYLTQSGVTITIVKAGLYHIDMTVLAENNTTGTQLDLYLKTSPDYSATGGNDQINGRERVDSNGWNHVHCTATWQLMAAATIIANFGNSAKNGSIGHHHEGPSWTRMAITYLGRGVTP